MSLCADCGTANEPDAKFCKTCGRALGVAAGPAPQAAAGTPAPASKVIEPPVGNDGLPAGVDLDGQPGGERIIWEGRPRLPLSWWEALTTRYTLTNERLIVKRGFISRRSEEIELYRVADVSFKQSIIERIFAIGDVRLETTDYTTPKSQVHNIRDVERVKDLIRAAARAERQRRRVLLRDEV